MNSFKLFLSIVFKIKFKQAIPDNVVSHDFQPRMSLTPYAQRQGNVVKLKTKKQQFKEALKEKYKNRDYSENAVGHLIFNINGGSHLFSIVELNMMGILD